MNGKVTAEMWEELARERIDASKETMRIAKSSLIISRMSLCIAVGAFIFAVVWMVQ